MITCLVGAYDSPISLWILNNEGVFKFISLLDHPTHLNGNNPMVKPCPSWLSLSANGKYLYFVNESKEGNGYVGCYDVNRNKLNGQIEGFKLLNNTVNVGQTPCHCVADQDNSQLAVADYSAVSSSGDLTIISLHFSEDAFLGKSLPPINHGSSAHVHEVVYAGTNPTTVMVCDLGLDQVFTYQVTDGNWSSIHVLTLTPPGCGPRHLVVHPNEQYAYVVCELNCTVCIIPLVKDAQGLQPASVPPEAIVSHSTLPTNQPHDEMGAAEILLSADHRYLYVSTRDISTSRTGPLDRSTITVFAVQNNGSALQWIQSVHAKGKYPRHMIFVPREGVDPDPYVGCDHLLLVCHQKTQNLVSFPVHTESGMIIESGAQDTSMAASGFSSDVEPCMILPVP